MFHLGGIERERERERERELEGKREKERKKPVILRVKPVIG